MNGLQPEAGLPTGDDEVLRFYAFWPEASELMAAAEMAMVGLPLFSRGCTERSMSCRALLGDRLSLYQVHQAPGELLGRTALTVMAGVVDLYGSFISIGGHPG
jgi:hypothetical protein